MAAGGAPIYDGGFPPLPEPSHVSRLFSRPDFRSGIRDMIPPLIGIFPFGVVCGVAAQAAGFTLLEAMGMALIVFSGSAQIIATQLLVAGAPFAVIVVTCFVIGLRLMMYSAAIAPHLKELPPRWRQLLAFVLTDQAFAASIRRFRTAPRADQKASYLLGNGVARDFEKVAATRSLVDPWSRGSHSHAVPGRFQARDVLARPVHAQLLFAGEHTDAARACSVHGAWLSGLRAAQQALRLLGRSVPPV